MKEATKWQQNVEKLLTKIYRCGIIIKNAVKLV